MDMIRGIVAAVLLLMLIIPLLDNEVFPHFLSRKICPAGTVPDPDNSKLCLDESDGHPVYYDKLKETIFMLMLFGAGWLIFSSKQYSKQKL